MTTNMAPPAILPQSVQQVAAAQRLGAFTKVYTTAVVRTIIGSLVFLAAAALFCAGGLLPPELTVTARIALLACGLLFLGLAFSLANSVIQVANQQIYLFEQGMVIDKGKQVQAFLWNQVSEVWQSITRTYRNGRYVGTTYVYRLRRADGYQVKLNNLTKDIAELGPTMAQSITRELFPRALHAIRAGQTLTFATFSVNRQGIGNGRDFLPWSQVQGLDVQQGRVTVKQAGRSRGSWSDKVANTPNFLVLTLVAEEMLQQAGAGRKPDQICTSTRRNEKKDCVVETMKHTGSNNIRRTL
jgi:hypothetical protein